MLSIQESIKNNLFFSDYYFLNIQTDPLFQI